MEVAFSQEQSGKDKTEHCLEVHLCLASPLTPLHDFLTVLHLLIKKRVLEYGVKEKAFTKYIEK